MNSPSQRIWGYETTGRLLRPVLQGPVAPADAAAAASDLGGGRLLHAGARHRLSHAVRPPAAHAEAGRQRAGLGRRRRPRLDGDPDDRGLGRQRHRGDLRGGQARVRRSPSAPRGRSTARTSTAGARCPTRWTPKPTASGVKEARKFGKAIWEITGKGNDVDMVFEHPGASTFPVSALVCKRGGMVVICAGTTGYKLTVDARYLWMRQKRLQGSHFANLKQATAANTLRAQPPGRSLHERGVRLDRHPAGAHEDAQEPAQAGQHGGAGPGQAAGHAHPRGSDGGLSLGHAHSRRSGPRQPVTVWRDDTASASARRHRRPVRGARDARRAGRRTRRRASTRRCWTGSSSPRTASPGSRSTVRRCARCTAGPSGSRPTGAFGELERLMLQAAFGEYLARIAGGMPMSQVRGGPPGRSLSRRGGKSRPSPTIRRSLR